MLCRFRCGRKCWSAKVRLLRAERVARRTVQTVVRSSSVRQGSLCRRAEWSRQSSGPRLRHFRNGPGADAEAPGQGAARLAGAGDLDANGGRGAGAGVDLRVALSNLTCDNSLRLAASVGGGGVARVLVVWSRVTKAAFGKRRSGADCGSWGCG